MLSSANFLENDLEKAIVVLNILCLRSQVIASTYCLKPEILSSIKINKQSRINQGVF